ncbi:MAG TPA: universal stress protein [Bacteroidota bacterium]|nr:universal stress protein [Bacteroidota bacterium]
MNRLKKILIPTDFSEYSLGVISHLAMLDLPKDVKVLFLHVLSENILVEPMLDMYLKEDNVAYSRTGEAEQYLKALAGERLVNYTRVDCVVRRGDPATEIVKLAEHDNAGLILMATHGRTGLAHIFMGSVAEKVVRTSHVPVLTAKPPEMRQPPISAEDVREQLHIK